MKKHITLVTRRPAVAQTNFEAFKDFLVDLTDQLVQVAFAKTGGGLK